MENPTKFYANSNNPQVYMKGVYKPSISFFCLRLYILNPGSWAFK